MLASVVLLLASLATFEGIAFAARVAHADAELLAADAFAWDALWMRFHSKFASPSNAYPASNPLVEREGTDFPVAAVPALHYDGSPVVLYTIVTNAADGAGTIIETNVEWGPARARRILAARTGNTARAEGHIVRVYRSCMNRVKP